MFIKYITSSLCFTWNIILFPFLIYFLFLRSLCFTWNIILFPFLIYFLLLRSLCFTWNIILFSFYYLFSLYKKKNNYTVLHNITLILSKIITSIHYSANVKFFKTSFIELYSLYSSFFSFKVKTIFSSFLLE